MSRWFRHYAGMVRDDKLVRAALRSKQTVERVVWVWGAILESAGEINDDGKFDLDIAEIAYFLRADEADIRSILDSLHQLDRIHENRVAKWGDRQFQSDQSADRVRAHRERKRGDSNAGNDSKSVTVDGCNGDVTLQKRPGNAPETELDTETEKKEDSSLRSLPPRSKKIHLPDDCQVSETGHAYAVAHGIPSSKVPFEWDRFKNHAIQNARLFAGQRGIEAAWRNWVTSPYQTAGPQKSLKEIKGADHYEAFQELKHGNRIRESGEGNGTLIGFLPPITSQ